MGYINNFSFEITDDGSAGMYDKNSCDILHSRTGALKEAQEKFINPLLKSYKEIPASFDILDICYGIGYNTKAALFNLNTKSVNIDALEINPELIFLSPFIKDGINDEYLKLFIFFSAAELLQDSINSCCFKTIDLQNISSFLSAHTLQYTAGYFSGCCDKSFAAIEPALLHNIYYQYISNKNKTGLKSNKYKECSLSFYIGDARKSIQKISKNYDAVFLDAYSPKKNPVLWTIDFLRAVKTKMKNKSVLISYSKAAPFRSALLELGFYTGKIYIDDKDSGTIASQDKSLINFSLDKSDLDIINTRSGIPYRDPVLSLSSDMIILNRNKEAASSDRISRTQFEKLKF